MKTSVNHSLKRNNDGEDELIARDSDPCQQPESGVTHLQEADVFDSLSGFILSFQSETTLHPIEASHQ